VALIDEVVVMAVEHVDVLIVGAGLSGIGSAVHLQQQCPDKTYAIFEARDVIGGTWDLFRYPGVRSDSDMFTLGYNFRPWTNPKAIADGPDIREYVRDTAARFHVDDKVRYHHRVVRAEWSSESAQWTVRAQRTDTGETVDISCSFLFSCTGYYRYDEGYTPVFPGRERFRGQIVHPQHWPEDLAYAGKRVVVIGSGATAVTLVPAMAETAGHVTMVQRSPTYMAALPSVDRIADALRRRLPANTAYSVVRWKNVLLGRFMYGLSRRRPEFMKRLLRKGITAALPEGYDVEAHFTPRYNPWDQRLCLVPDGDLFRAIRKGTVSITTGEIETFTETGVRMTSGEEVPADIIITATGLNMLMIGGMRLAVDGSDVDLHQTVAYKGMMLSGVPNFAIAVGYTNASWTLKCDLVATYVTRLLSYMDRHGYASVTPLTPDTDDLAPLIDLTSGYVQRSIEQLPRQGPAAPWRLYQNYPRDRVMLKRRSVADRGVRFARSTKTADRTPQPAQRNA
jgi:cation diffusion facilitator CzcD-associated flavoprotein CzcO